MSTLVCGIDFGTSNTVFEVFDSETKRVISLDATFTKRIESVLYFPFGEREHYYLGSEATRHYVESGMKGRYIKSVKSALAVPALGQISVHGAKVKIEKLVSFFLQHIKATCETFYDGEITHVVLGRPSQYSPDPAKDKLAETRLKKAAQLAGFTHIQVVKEPVAAAIEYRQSIDTPRQVFVGDFGAGTSDFCVMSMSPGLEKDVHLSDDVLGTAGLKVGGDDFDAEIMWDKLVTYFGYGAEYKSFDKWLPIPAHIFRTICSWEKLSFLRRVDMQNSLKTFHHSTNEKEKVSRLLRLINDNLGFSIIKSVESAKIQLSDSPSSVIIYNNENIQVDHAIQTCELGVILKGFITKLEENILSFMENIEVSPNDIDVVFLTGGSSLMTPVRQMMVDYFGEEKIQEGNAFKSVAYGLAASARHLF